MGLLPVVQDNPRTGQWAPAKATEGETFSAPDEEDWVLLFQSSP